MAIAVDNTSSGYTAGGNTSLTYAHTCAGSDRVLIVVAWAGLNTSTPVFTATYNGVSMTQLFDGTATNWRYRVFYLVAPATGANNVVVSCSSGNGYIYSCSASYTDVDQTTPIDATDTHATFSSATSTSDSITTVTNNAWALMAMPINSGGGSPIAAGTATTRRSAVVFGGNGEWVALFDKNGATSPAGSATLNATMGSSSGYTAPFALRPVGAASGPANLKSYNTNLKANIKSINTNLIANVKSLNTNV
jgi:hypothetical protein